MFEQGMAGFLIDSRPHVFLTDGSENRHFLEAVDTDYWRYQGTVHGDALASEHATHRQRAAVALRLAYGQGVETLFAFIGALLQAPVYPIGWINRYTNQDLRAVIQKIQSAEARLQSVLPGVLTWESIAELVHSSVSATELKEHDVVQRFASAWRLLASDYLDRTFEPDYNSLKHGMRSTVGGFTVGFSVDSPTVRPGVDDPVQIVGDSTFGNTFWMRPRKIEGSKYTYDFDVSVSRSWSPTQFIARLDVIACSMKNIVSHLSLCAGAQPADVRFEIMTPETCATARRRGDTRIGNATFSQPMESAQGYKEPSVAELCRMYETSR